MSIRIMVPDSCVEAVRQALAGVLLAAEAHQRAAECVREAAKARGVESLLDQALDLVDRAEFGRGSG